MLELLFNRAWARRVSQNPPGSLEAASFVLRTNKRYRATVTLVGFEAWGTNMMIEDKFRELGFKEAKVNGTGSVRQGEALWPGQERNVPLPIDPHLSNVTELA
jgi:hypothetical protein